MQRCFHWRDSRRNSLIAACQTRRWRSLILLLGLTNTPYYSYWFHRASSFVSKSINVTISLLKHMCIVLPFASTPKMNSFLGSSLRQFTFPPYLPLSPPSRCKWHPWKFPFSSFNTRDYFFPRSTALASLSLHEEHIASPHFALGFRWPLGRVYWPYQCRLVWNSLSS